MTDNRIAVDLLSSLIVDCSDLIEYSDLYLGCSPARAITYSNSQHLVNGQIESKRYLLLYWTSYLQTSDI